MVSYVTSAVARGTQRVAVLVHSSVPLASSGRYVTVLMPCSLLL